MNPVINDFKDKLFDDTYDESDMLVDDSSENYDEIRSAINRHVVIFNHVSIVFFFNI